MSFMHKFEQFIDNSFQELPVSSEKSWVLANDIPAIRASLKQENMNFAYLYNHIPNKFTLSFQLSVSKGTFLVIKHEWVVNIK